MHRPALTDSERTKLLKEVLASTVRHTSAGSGSDRRLFIDQSSPFAAQRGRSKSSPQRRPGAPQRVEDFDLAAAERTDGFIVDLAGGTDLLPALKDNERRIRALRTRLKAWEGDLFSAARAVPSRDTGSGRDVCFLPRADDKAPEMDRAALRVIHHSARFPRLEELESVIEQSATYEELREAELKSGGKAFPRKCLHHPGIFLLTDHAMHDPDEFQRAICAPLTPIGEPAQRPEERTLFPRPRALQSQSPAARSRSVPTLKRK